MPRNHLGLSSKHPFHVTLPIDQHVNNAFAEIAASLSSVVPRHKPALHYVDPKALSVHRGGGLRVRHGAYAVASLSGPIFALFFTYSLDSVSQMA